MAKVDITNRLITDVRTQIARVLNKAEKLLVVTENPFDQKRMTPELLQKFVDIYEKEAWGEHIHLRELIPKTWMKLHKDLTITVLRDDTRLVSASDIPLTPLTAYGPPTHAYTDSIVIRTNEFDDPAFCAQAIKYYEAGEEHQVKKELITSQVISFLKSHKTLNKALIAFPDIEMYIPLDYMTRVRRPNPTRAAREKKEVEEREAAPVIDRDVITSIAVVSRLTT